MRLLFRLRTGSAGLLKDMKRCKMIIAAGCLMYESDTGEDVDHLLVTCGEFERDQWVLVDEVSRIVGAGEAGGIWVSARRVRWHCSWQKVWNACHRWRRWVNILCIR